MGLGQHHPENAYEGVRALVLGASGFIGRWVARSLCAQGATVISAVRNRLRAEPILNRCEIRGEIIELDLREDRAVSACLQQVRPSITFNLAGYGVYPTERDEAIAYPINTHLIDLLCAAISPIRDTRWPGQDIVHTGSALEYGTIDGDLAEDLIPHPTTLYGKTKLAGTLALARQCAVTGLKGLTARLFTVYGPGEHAGRLLPSLLQAAASAEPVPLTAGAQKRDFTYVADVAEGLLRLGLAPSRPGEVVNLATGRLHSVRGFVECAARIFGIAPHRLLFGALPTRAEEMQHSEVNVGRLCRMVSWTPPTGIEEGIRQTEKLLRRP